MEKEIYIKKGGCLFRSVPRMANCRLAAKKQPYA